MIYRHRHHSLLEVGFSLFLIIWIGTAHANSAYFQKNPVGWHWNDVTLKSVSKEHKHPRPKAPQLQKVMGPIQEVAKVHHAMIVARDRAVLNPTVASIHAYMIIQQAIENKATQFTMNWQKMLLLYPQYNYGVTHPTEAVANQLYQDRIRALKEHVVHRLSRHFGLLYFYRGSNPLSHQMAKTVVAFAKWNHFALIGVSMDHLTIPVIAENKANRGQATRLGVKALPALVLVNPKTGQHQVMAYGYLSQNELTTAAFNVSTHFKGLL